MKRNICFTAILILCAIFLSACSVFQSSGNGAGSSSENQIDMLAGESTQFTSNDPEAAITCFSSDDSIVSASEDGRICAIGEGCATVTVSIDGRPCEYTVNVSLPPITSIAFSEASTALKVGEKLETQIVQAPESAKDGEYIFTSSDERIVTVDADGVITAVGVGEAAVTAVLAGDEDVSCSLSLTTSCDSVSEMYFETPYCSLCPEDTYTLTLITEPYGAAQNIEWASSKESVACVDGNGNVTALKRGTAVITASLGDTQASCFVTVAKRPPASPIAEIEAPRYTLNENGMLARENADDTGSASLMLIGDLMCLSAQQNSVRSGGVCNFNGSFSIVRDIFAKSDFAIGNLETLISHSNSYSAESKTVNGNPNCNGPATYLDAVRYAGLDAVALSNNHSGDGGLSGIYDTLLQIDKYGLARTGVFGSSREQRYMIADINGISVGIVSYTDHVNSGARSIPADRRGVILNYYTPDKARADISALKEAGAEYIIVYMHWGTENTHSVNSVQKAWAQELADMGADLIAGSHPHCLQKAEILTAADGRPVTCIYSMGNFVSSMGSTINNDTIILNVDLKRDGDAILADVGYIGCRVIGNYNGEKYVVVPVSPELNGGDSGSALVSAQKRINKVMGDAIAEITAF